jgi:hypothetical protein
MFSNPWLYLILLGSIIIGVLAFFAFKLMKQLKQQTIDQDNTKKTQQLAWRKHDKKVLASVIIIVRAMKEAQCDLAEGCWRLSVLLDSLKLSSELSTQFPAIFKLYEAIKHMPILEKRKKLTKQERMKLDLERMKVEAELATGIHEDIKLLHQYANERVSVLSAEE